MICSFYPTKICWSRRYKNFIKKQQKPFLSENEKVQEELKEPTENENVDGSDSTENVENLSKEFENINEPDDDKVKEKSELNQKLEENTTMNQKIKLSALEEGNNIDTKCITTSIFFSILK